MDKAQSASVSEINVTSSVAGLFLTNKMTDVTFIVPNGTNSCSSFPAHKLILSIRSSVFKAMFNGNFTETHAKEVEIPDTNAEAFETILRFIYKDEVILDDCKHVHDVLYLAEKYSLSNVIFNECVNHLCKKICVENFADVSNIATVFFTGKSGFGKLKRNLWRFLSENGECFIKSKAFTRLDFDAVCELLCRDSLNVVSEVAIFNSLVNWATLQCVKSGDIITLENKLNVLNRSHYLVRYMNMSLGEFNEGPAISGLLSTTEIDCIRRAIVTRTCPAITYSASFTPSTWSDARGLRISAEKARYIEIAKGVDALGTQKAESVLILSSQDVILTSIKYLNEVSDKVKTVVINMSDGQEQFSANCRYLKSVEPNVYLKANVIYKILTCTTLNVLPIGAKRNFYYTQELNNCRPFRVLLKSYPRKNISQDDIKKDVTLDSLLSDISKPHLPLCYVELSTVIQSLSIVT